MLVVVKLVYALIAVPTVTESPLVKLVYAFIAVPKDGFVPLSHAVISSAEIAVPSVVLVIVNTPLL